MSTSSLKRLDAPTPDGTFIAHYSVTGLAQLDFPRSTGNPPPHIKKSGNKTRRQSDDAPKNSKIDAWHRRTMAALKQILAGRAPRALPPLDVSNGTEFQRRVWVELKKIKPGRTLSYGEIAGSIGRPKAVRAVGGACGANPIPVLIPCHRVLAASRKIGGFSGGIGWKKTLLARENVTVS
jgi:O-6-methylguanine DNA methyltransferase